MCAILELQRAGVARKDVAAVEYEPHGVQSDDLQTLVRLLVVNLQSLAMHERNFPFDVVLVQNFLEVFVLVENGFVEALEQGGWLLFEDPASRQVSVQLFIGDGAEANLRQTAGVLLLQLLQVVTTQNDHLFADVVLLDENVVRAKVVIDLSLELRLADDNGLIELLPIVRLRFIFPLQRNKRVERQHAEWFGIRNDLIEKLDAGRCEGLDASKELVVWIQAVDGLIRRRHNVNVGFRFRCVSLKHMSSKQPPMVQGESEI